MENEEKENIPNIKKQGWKAEKIAEEATNKESDEITREMLRGDANTDKQINADERDVVGSVDSDETPHGREETKHKNGG